MYKKLRIIILEEIYKTLKEEQDAFDLAGEPLQSRTTPTDDDIKRSEEETKKIFQNPRSPMGSLDPMVIGKPAGEIKNQHGDSIKVYKLPAGVISYTSLNRVFKNPQEINFEPRYDAKQAKQPRIVRGQQKGGVAVVGFYGSEYSPVKDKYAGSEGYGNKIHEIEAMPNIKVADLRFINGEKAPAGSASRVSGTEGEYFLNQGIDALIGMDTGKNSDTPQIVFLRQNAIKSIKFIEQVVPKKEQK